MQELEVTPLPIVLPGGCTACLYEVAGQPDSGWQRGGAIWGTCGADMGCVWAHWARPLGPCTICARAFLSATPLIMRDLPMPGRPCEVVSNPPDGGPQEAAASN